MSVQEGNQTDNAPRIGVLAYQGDVREHVATLREAGAEPVEVLQPEQLQDLAGLVLPGGESTTIGKLMARFGMDKAIHEAYDRGMAVFGTCAGLILLAKDIENSDQLRLGLMDITAARNAFGRQVQSFESGIDVPLLGEPPGRGVFIRAPYVKRVGDGVEVLARFRDRVVLVRQGRLLAGAFHPELIGDARLHRFFVEMAARKRA